MTEIVQLYINGTYGLHKNTFYSKEESEYGYKPIDEDYVKRKIGNTEDWLKLTAPKQIKISGMLQIHFSHHPYSYRIKGVESGTGMCFTNNGEQKVSLDQMPK